MQFWSSSSNLSTIIGMLLNKEYIPLLFSYLTFWLSVLCGLLTIKYMYRVCMYVYVCMYTALEISYARVGILFDVLMICLWFIVN